MKPSSSAALSAPGEDLHKCSLIRSLALVKKLLVIMFALISYLIHVNIGTLMDYVV